MKWKIDNNYGEFLYIVEDQGKRCDNPVVCQLYEDVTPEDSVTIGNWYESFPGAEANARLIAAAPDLLEALESVRDTFGATKIVCDAINKAKGEMK